MVVITNKKYCLEMKFFKINIHVFSMMMSIIAMTTTTSCTDIVTYDEYTEDPGTSGTPVITGIYDAEDRELFSPLTEAEFNRFIMIKGSNLGGVEQVLLNDVEVDPKEVYATASSVWLQVPASAPDNITNKIYYRTSHGNTEFDFTVIIPDVEVVGLYNEMVPAGSKTKLVGNYFELHGFGKKESSKITMNGKPLEISEVSDNGLTLLIPEGTPGNATIDVEWNGVSGHKKVSVPYNNTDHLIYQDWTGMYWGDGVLVTTPSGTEPPVICGPYLKVDRSFGAWDWYTVFGCGFGLPSDVEANIDDYVLKFEVCSNLETPFPENGNFGYMFILGNDANKWAWNPSASQSFNTFGEWCTVRIDLSLLTSSIKPTGWCDFRLNFQPMNACDIKHYFSGFRFEKKLK